MANTTFASGRGIAHKGSGNLTAPGPIDVCKTPSPGAPVPIPYANLIDAKASAGNEDAKTKQKKMKQAAASEGYDADSATQAAIKSHGDEAGTVGGIVTNRNRGKAEFVMYSFDVKFEGKNVSRAGNPLFHGK